MESITIGQLITRAIDASFGKEYIGNIKVLAHQDDPQALGLLLDAARKEGPSYDDRQRCRAAQAAITELFESCDFLILANAAGDQSSWVRKAAIKALAKRDDPRVVEVFIGGAEDKEAGVRIAALEALAERDDPRVVEVLITAATAATAAGDDEHEDLWEGPAAVKEAAIKALVQRFRTCDADVLIRAAKAGARNVRIPAIKALAKREDTPCLEALIGLTKDVSFAIRRVVVRALAERDDPGVLRTPIGAAEAERNYSRWRLLPDLSPFIQASREEEEALGATPPKPSWELSQSGDPLVLEALISAATDEDTIVRQMAIKALAPRDIPGVLRVLTDAAGDAAAGVRLLAIMALAQRDGAGVLEILIGAVDDKSHHVRRYAVHALAQRDHPRIPKVLARATTDKDTVVREMAYRALAKVRDSGQVQQVPNDGDADEYENEGLGESWVFEEDEDEEGP